MSRELVTITVLRTDVEDAITDIHLSHGQLCLSSDGCDCMARAERLDAALRTEPLYKRMLVHEYQDWDTRDTILYPSNSAPTVCSCGATPGLPPKEGDWAWWVAHVTSLIDKEVEPDAPQA